MPYHFTVVIMLTVSETIFLHCKINLILNIFAARKALEQLVPIVRGDNDIDSILERADQSIKSIIDLFIKANTGIHVMRAIEPNLRFRSAAIQNLMQSSPYIPHCEYWDSDQSGKCIRIASQKQIGAAIIKYTTENS